MNENCFGVRIFTFPLRVVDVGMYSGRLLVRAGYCFYAGHSRQLLFEYTIFVYCHITLKRYINQVFAVEAQVLSLHKVDLS